MSDKRLRLPDFCAGPAVVAIILIVVLTAVVIALARQDAVVALWTDLARTALFLLWHRSATCRCLPTTCSAPATS